VSRADDISKLYDALTGTLRVDQPQVDEPISPGLQGLLDQLNQGATQHLHPPELMEGPLGEVYSDPSAPKVVVVVSAKGGVGRTTLTAALASGLQRQGHPALALDLDPQDALRHHLAPGVTMAGVGATSLLNKTWQALPVRGFAGCRVVAFGETDAVQQQSLNRWLGQDLEFLTKRLGGMKLSGRDTVIIDVPAGNSAYLSQAMSVADVVLVVVQADVASFRSLAQMDSVLAPYLAHAKSPYRFYVINQVDPAHRFSEDMVDVFKLRLGDALLGTIQRDPSFIEAQAYGRDPLDPVSNSAACQDLSRLCRSLLGRIN
jgi:cellulose synthase operon protein YhjQ